MKIWKRAVGWLKDCVCHHKGRLAAGLIVFVAELVLFLASGVLLEDETNFLSGEGSWEEYLTEGSASFCQEFQPEHRHLRSLSFLVSLTDVTERDGEVAVVVADKKGRVLFEKSLGFDELSDGRFTDVEVDLTLSTWEKYDLTLIAKPSSAGEYPTVSVCDTSWDLPESRSLQRGDETFKEWQLVTRYVYEEALTDARLGMLILLSLLTALGVGFGLPKNIKLRRAVGILIMVAAPFVLGSRLESLTFDEVYALPITMRFRTMDYLPFALLWNLGIMYAAELVIFLCTHSTRVTIVLTNIAVTLLYSVNYFVIAYRGTPLRVNDFTAIGTAAKVVGDYSFEPNSALALVWCWAILFVVWGVQTGKALKPILKLSEKEDSSKIEKRPAGRKLWRFVSYGVTIAVAVVITVWGGHLLLYTDLLDRVGFSNEEFKGFYQDMLYYRNGYLVATCIEVRNSRILVPGEYSRDRVEELLEENREEQELSEEEISELPHVILVMNESFADLRVLADLELSQENLSFFNSLKENTVRGYVNASVLGGGTANSEFEVFTGCTVSFFPVNYYPYQQAVKRPIDTLVSRMESYGYRTVSMHPEAAGNWNRTNVYRYYGFDESLWKPDFAGAEVVHSGVSDEETYKRIIELYENRQQDEKLFIFDLTMQNHGGYSSHGAPYEVQETRMQNPILDEYLSLVKISDEAFEDLVQYFQEQDEKVVICMYGDHQPWVSDLIVNYYYKGMHMPPEQMMDKYKTPFVIWANYDIEEAEGYDISMNYLGGLLLRTAGIPLSPYFTFLEQQREEYPIVTINGYVDKDGNYANWGSEGDEFPEYRMLQYNYLFDENTVQWGY
ncbi:MAG: LTA synthase family protein [Acetatifactor sp.]|nr:LTA synthase family protein [Acetatifactor sp.]